MRVLFLHANTPDYLSAGLFHGLRSVLGSNCVDLPRFDCMYSPLSSGVKEKIRANAFTLYGLLDEIPEMADQRFFIWQKNIHEFDYYIIADIWNQWETYIKLTQVVSEHKIIIVDPSDSTRVFPYNNFSESLVQIFYKWYYFKKDKIKYFKREIPPSPKLMTGFSFLPNYFSRFFLPKKLYPISFSIPIEKIKKVKIESKRQLFTSVMVDSDFETVLNENFFIPLGKEVYKFSKESDYYEDIQISRFGVTTKRSGWDCLRHYEYAANGAVLCFKQLNNKSEQSAPHGLGAHNCIIYDSVEDLIKQIKSISDEEYLTLLDNSYKWIEERTTVAVASNFINLIKSLD